jgi:poly-gamma-glutamate synthesis protein (capsule biosynthesis protein)
LPTEKIRKLAAQFIQAGADVIVGTHPHVFGKVDCIQDRPVIYSLGNFLFDQKYEETKSGALLQCKINDDFKTSLTLHGVEVLKNAYLPRPAKSNLFQKENEFLASCTFEVQPTWTGIFTQDRKIKGLRLTRDRDPANTSLACLELFDLKTGKRELRTPAMPIWKLQPVDINQDGLSEILLIQYVYSALDNEVAKRIYIYSLNDNFHALWRGSGLSRPLLDAAFINNRQGIPVLIALHTGDSFLLRDPLTSERVLMSYRWNGFGFLGYKELELKIPAAYLSCLREKIRLIGNNNLILQEIPVNFFN